MKNNNVKKVNIVYFLLVTILIVAFLFISSNLKVQNTNTNTNVINIKEKVNKKININVASKEELMSIDGIGNKKSDSIIKNRPYENIWSLEKAHISEQFIKKIQDKISAERE
jgi:competence protein ComEA